MMTARRPATGTSYASRMAITARAVAGTKAGSPRANQPAFVGVAPSTSFAGSMRSTRRRPCSASTSGWATTMPATRGSRFSRSIASRSGVVSSVSGNGSTPTLRAARSRLAAYRSPRRSTPIGGSRAAGRCRDRHRSDVRRDAGARVADARRRPDRPAGAPSSKPFRDRVADRALSLVEAGQQPLDLARLPRRAAPRRR